MEENIDEEDPDCYYTYFRMQNASPENVIFFISTKMSASGDQIRIAPGEQGTWWQTMEKMPWIDDNDVLAKIWMRWDSLNCISILTWKED